MGSAVVTTHFQSRQQSQKIKSMADNNNVDNDHFQEGNGIVFPRLESFQHWLDRNGLREEDETEGIREDRARVQESNDYEASLHRQYFATWEEEQATTRLERLKVLQQAPRETISLIPDVKTNHHHHPDGAVPIIAPLQPLASACETIFALVASWDKYQCQPDEAGNIQPSRNAGQVISLSLPFNANAVQQFVDLVLQKITLQDIVNASDETEHNEHEEEHPVIVCTRLAHYLQNATILDVCVNHLMQVIDTDNCLALSQLADQLHLPRLFERALGHMMDSMDNVVEVLDESEQEHGLTRELRERIESIQTAVRTSLHSTNHKRLYFSSLEEYIAIFAERVQYYKERLAEAEEQQEQRPNNYARAWHDAQVKINRQKVRVHTLEAALREQKKMFARSMQNHGSVET
ncbi:hypothetical protein MPSEU_000922100 [Mayamaea pseudoterrestris]|nr:hypothetical protein MPSEU_000922100 [Mayamaea pseudoterrestris]